jgi:hypothetical protein
MEYHEPWHQGEEKTISDFKSGLILALDEFIPWATVNIFLKIFLVFAFTVLLFVNGIIS